MDYRYNATVEEIYDGDTITVIIDLGLDTFTRKKLRLHNIDTPELRGSEREAGLIARDYLRELILGKSVVIETIKDKTGKYGRYLAIVYINNENINDKLVSEGYAKRYR